MNSTAPLVTKLWPAEGRVPTTVRMIVLALAGTLLLFASAKVQVPFWPVPATLQTLAVVLIGAFYGSRLGLATLATYLAEGAAGLPVFAGTPEKGIGLAYMMGPTGGYLLGYLLAAYVVGRLVESGFARSIVTTALAVAAGNVALYACGLAWLGYLIGAEKAVMFGLVPFIAAEVVKIALATTLITALQHRRTAA